MVGKPDIEASQWLGKQPLTLMPLGVPIFRLTRAFRSPVLAKSTTVDANLTGFRLGAPHVTQFRMETPKTRRRLKIFFDGGCRPNPGRIEAAVVVRGVPHLFDDLGHGNNSDAEWLALICALELAHSLSLT